MPTSAGDINRIFKNLERHVDRVDKRIDEMMKIKQEAEKLKLKIENDYINHRTDELVVEAAYKLVENNSSEDITLDKLWEVAKECHTSPEELLAYCMVIEDKIPETTH